MGPRIQDILVILDALNASGQMRYDDYSRLHDMVSALGEPVSDSNGVDG